MDTLSLYTKAPIRTRVERLSQSGSLSAIFLVFSSLGVGLISLWFAAIDNRTALFLSYFAHPAIAVLNLIPVVFLALLLFFLTGRAWLGYTITALAVTISTVGSYFKLTFRNDPLMLGDLLLLKEAGNMAGQYDLFLNKSMIVALLLLVLMGAFLYLFARGRIGVKPRLAGTALLLAGLFPLWSLYSSGEVYYNVTRNEALISPWSATQVYTSKGFVYPFLYSAKETLETPPEGYDQNRAMDILSAYTDGDIPPDERADIFAIQLEAYSDFTRYQIPGLNSQVYELYHALEEESFTGNLLTNVFAGGTVDTERCFITGLKDLGTFRAPTNSYAWYFRGQGYYTQGSHPCYNWFYNRRNVNPNLGFEDYYFVENHFSPMTGGEPGMDKVLFPEIIAQYEDHRASSDAPYFSFNITYQGHGPYETERRWWGEGHVDRQDYTEEEYNLLNNYFGSIEDTNRQLAAFFDYFRDRERPVVILLYGDHNPWMGDNNSIYHRLGINLDLDTQEGFFNYYGTRYLIWANDAARDLLSGDFLGEGPDIGPYFLMNQLFRLTGWDGPAFLQAVDTLMDSLPVMNTATGLFIEDGTLTDSVSGERGTLLRDYESLQYYWKKHFNF